MSCVKYWSPGKYPPARRSDHVDSYASEKQGRVSVHDPYKWLEHDTVETRDWVSAQEKYARQFLDAGEDRVRLEVEIKNSTNYERYGQPSLKKDGRWYWLYNSGLQAQSVHYRSRDSTLPSFSAAQSTANAIEVFFDPNVLSEDGTVSITTASFSRDGKWFAYALSRSGSDFATIYVRSTEDPLTSGKDDRRLADEVRFVKFSSITWTNDHKGFFYQRFPDRASHGEASEDKAGTETQSDIGAMVFYHRVGTPQLEDILVMKNSERPEWMWGTSVTEIDGRWLVLYTSRDTSRKVKVWVADLEKDTIGQNLSWIKLIDDFEASYEVIGNDGTKLYLHTNASALQYRIITIDIADYIVASQNDPAHISKIAQDLVPEDPEAKLEDARIIGHNKLALHYQRDVKDVIYIHDLTSGKRLKHIAEDHVGSITISGRRDQDWLFLLLTGFTNPGVVARCGLEDSAESKIEIWRQSHVGGLAGAGGFVTEQVWYPSKDGTRIPMFVVRHKDTALDGSAPVLQFGYGGFTISITPFFSPSMLTFLHAYGAILAVPNIRGGGEFGEEWHLAGTRERKVNCFDDFIAASEWLVEHKYTSKGKIIINGSSNGGLLVAACANRAPEGLLGAAVAEVGVYDLLKFADFTIGRAWTSDFGDPHDPHDFDFIFPISPLHNVTEDKIYPPTILLTADHDDRVVPLHSFKYAATLQHHRANNPHPLLLRVERKAGHGAGKTTEQRIKEAADKWSFVAQTLGLKWRVSQAEEALSLS
ncbi:prolyl oligopeptidase [Vararia minispora EC-137]|uniref:Prolyl oligopeptidase n=1 Tax=Vararia minispora EC-137 TaxID=1314806 RepID=A0ACB8QS72_9AGAM|nr:prolyl oligopeptidase [Vararia minispora EC-137]